MDVKMNPKTEIQNVKAMIRTMEDQLNILNELTDTLIQESYGFNLSIKEKIKPITMHEIENMVEDDMVEFVKSLDNDETSYNNLINAWRADEDENITLGAYGRKCLKDIKDKLLKILKMEDDRDHLIEDVNKMSSDYFKYINSKEYKEKKIAQLNDMKQKAEEENDPIKKKKMDEMIETMMKAETLEFFYDRINEDPEQIPKIIRKFFDESTSQYIIKRFRDRLPRFGYNETTYTRLFNIEETFLPEEYHDLNNIFLFSAIYQIAYFDPYNNRDSMYTTTLLVKMVNLMFHQFGDEESEKEFIEFIRKYDEQFLPYIEEFKEKNITSPNHPVRVEKAKEAEEKHRTYLISKLNDKGVEVDVSLTTKELGAKLLEIEKAEADAVKKQLQDLKDEEENSDDKSDDESEDTEAEDKNEETEDSKEDDDHVEETIITPEDITHEWPFNPDLLNYLNPIKESAEYYINDWKISAYEKIYPNIPYVLGIDGYNGDDNAALVAINPENGNVALHGKFTDIKMEDFSDLVEKLVTTYIPKTVIVDPRDGDVAVTVGYLARGEVEKNLFFTEEMEQDAVIPVYGFSKNSYPISTMKILADRVYLHPSLFNASDIIEDIKNLTTTEDKHIAPVKGSCPSLSAYLNAFYILVNEESKLDRFGIKAIPMIDQDPQKSYETIQNALNNQISEEQFDEIMEKIEESPEKAELDQMMEDTSKELHESLGIKDEENPPVVGESSSEIERVDIDDLEMDDTESIEVTPAEEKALTQPEEVEVYMDQYHCYYRKTPNGDYTYYDEHDEVIDNNISEVTILQLMSTGSVQKVMKTF